MNEMSKKIEDLREEVERLQKEIRELEKQNSNYYIGYCNIAYDDGCGSYYTESYFYLLGFISEASAKAWADKQEEEKCDVEGAGYFEVTEEIYNKYKDWRGLEKLSRCIDVSYPTTIKINNLLNLTETIDKAINDLKTSIGIERYSYEWSLIPWIDD